MELVMERSEYEKYQRAKAQVKEIKGFYSHLSSYVVVIAILIYINLNYSPEYLWFLWTLVCWGIGLLFHAMRVFNWIPFLNKEWEERKIRQFMEEEKNINKFK